MNTEQKDGSTLKKAFGLGFVGIFAYLASYYIRNLLSVAAPGMKATGAFTADFIGTLSSVYFWCTLWDSSLTDLSVIRSVPSI